MPATKNKPDKSTTPSPAVSKMREKLHKLGLRGDRDFALHLPLRYEDETRVVPIREASLSFGSAQVEGVVTACEVQFRPRRQLIVTLADESAPLTMRFINFYQTQVKQLAEGTRVRARGEVRHGFFGNEMVHPTYKVVDEHTPLPKALTPVYPAAEGVPQAYLRKAIEGALKRVRLEDTLPDELRDSLGLMPFERAVRELHQPDPETDQEALLDRSHPAWVRMKFDELLAQQLSLKRAQRARREKSAPVLAVTGELHDKLLAQLPFSLTEAQRRVLGEIHVDLASPYPMHRLLQGDVGSGKTVVAALAAARAIDSGYQAALMAPTEILADQHFHKIAAWMEPLGVEVAWLTGSLRKKEKDKARERIESGQARLVIGTHALIQDGIAFERLGLVIVDEQHRFGVGQRLALRNKGREGSKDTPTTSEAASEPHSGLIPHQLMMSATPIPRTLAMTYYADLEVSVIDQLPPGRSPVVTRVVDQVRRNEVIGRIQHAVQEGRQVYWVCPLIEESETLQLKTATETYDDLVAALPTLHIGLVHGRMKPAEKQAVMEAFSSNHTQVLVATTVIEVGVDVPNASLMVIEHAERFGLSQLHQLRGRVGRGSAESVCLLLYQSPLGQVARQRLHIMRETTDGFEIARRDLQIRGPGEFLGARQSGQALLRFADLETDQWIVQQARQIAHELLAHRPDVVEAHLDRWLGVKEEYLRV